MVKILAGEFRSRKLLTPDDDRSTRPFLNRVKESVFGMLHECFDGANVLDLFAGVGTVGLEAVSRGAQSVLMVENNQRTYKLLQQNIEALGCADRATSMLGDALGQTCLLRAQRPVDLVFVDPPFAMIEDPMNRARIVDQILRCAEIMGERGFVVLRSPIGTDEADFEITGFDGPEVHKYRKDMWAMLYQPAPSEPPPQMNPETAAGETPADEPPTVAP